MAFRNALASSSRLPFSPLSPVASRYAPTGVVHSIASSSRVKLDHLPRFASTTTTTTTRVAEPSVEELESTHIPTPPPAAASSSSPAASSSSSSSSSSSPSPSSTPRPSASASASPVTRGRTQTHTPTFSRPALSTHRWTPESPTVGSGDAETLPTHTLHVHSTRNNVILNLTDGLGPLLGTISGGTDKTFKKSQRSSYEAATQASIKMFDRVTAWAATAQGHQGKIRIRVAFNGMFGVAREAVSAALAGPEGAEMRKLVKRVEDRTKVKIGGVRAPKPRRL